MDAALGAACNLLWSLICARCGRECKSVDDLRIHLGLKAHRGSGKLTKPCAAREADIPPEQLRDWCRVVLHLKGRRDLELPEAPSPAEVQAAMEAADSLHGAQSWRRLSQPQLEAGSLHLQQLLGERLGVPPAEVQQAAVVRCRLQGEPVPANMPALPAPATPLQITATSSRGRVTVLSAQPTSLDQQLAEAQQQAVQKMRREFGQQVEETDSSGDESDCCLVEEPGEDPVPQRTRVTPSASCAEL